jgi:hypothetical protein
MSPGKSFLFFLTAYHPGINLFGDRVSWLVEPGTSAGSGALMMALENPWEGIVFMPDRTHNRNRSPR